MSLKTFGCRTFASLTFGARTLHGIGVRYSLGRFFSILAEARMYLIPVGESGSIETEDRSFTIEVEQRPYSVTAQGTFVTDAEDRSYAVPEENRIYTVEAL